jgi:hypothetical protein
VRGNEPPITELIILDAVRKDFLTLSQCRLPEFHKLVLVGEGNLKDHCLLSQLRTHFPGTEIFTFNFEVPGQRRCMCEKPLYPRQIFKPQPLYQEVVYCREVKWGQRRRVAFHLYIMAFGANHCSSLEHLLRHLTLHYP